KPRRIAAPRRGSGLPAKAELLDELAVTRGVLPVQVVEQPAAPVDHLQQAAPAVVVLLVGLEVFGQVRDARAEQGDLDLRRAGVVLAALVFGNDLAVVDRHSVPRDARPAGTEPGSCPDAPHGPPRAVVATSPGRGGGTA